MKKRLFSLLFALTIVLTACTTVDNNPQGNKGPKKPLKVEYWHTFAEPTGGATIDRLAGEYNQKQDDIAIEAVYQEGNYKGLMTNLQLASASASLPALSQMGYLYTNYFANNFDYIDFEKMVDTYHPDDSDFFKETFEDNVYNLAKTADDEQVGLPYSLSGPVLFYNEDLLASVDATAEDLKTWEGIYATAKKLNEKNNKAALYMPVGDHWIQESLIKANGGRMLDENNQASFASAEGIEAYELYQDMVLNNLCLNTEYMQGHNAFIGGEIAMLYTTAAMRDYVLSNANFEVKAVKAPSFKGKEAERIIPAGGNFLTMPTNDENTAARVWDFVKYLYETENVKDWITATGYLPMTKASAQDEDIAKLLKEDSVYSANYQGIDKLGKWAPFPGNTGLKAQEVLVNMMDRILDGEDVRNNLEHAEDEINHLIEADS